MIVWERCTGTTTTGISDPWLLCTEIAYACTSDDARSYGTATRSPSTSSTRAPSPGWSPGRSSSNSATCPLTRPVAWSLRVWMSLSPTRSRPLSAGAIRVQSLAQPPVELDDAHRALVDRREHLDVPHGVGVIERRQTA